MSQIAETFRPTTPSGRQPGLLGPVRLVLQRWCEHRRKRRALIHLAGLDDHLLRDVGITRGELYHEIARTTWRW
ncbi:DUF1127 domain-containing protein [Arenibaculum pallidiluteum]|uniref:DUF1127 domain-containing protein n=1 Tax=Arenibaculum pallidiluteum TaxID=2812559 RepID=UPI001A97A006|nr:DUF1127 domain-containing protein [Arenibaculum pallidiluteum]